MSSSKIAVLGSKIQYLTAEIQHARENKESDKDAQDELYDTIEDLQVEISEPFHWPGGFLTPLEFAVIQVAFQYKLFEHVPYRSAKAGKNGTTTPPSITAKELALAVGMDESILVRVMRLLIVNQIFCEIDEKVFTHSRVSAGMLDEQVSAHLGGLHHDIFKATTSLTDAIRGGHKSAFEARFGMPIFQYFEKKSSEERLRMSKSMASGQNEAMREVAKMYPWEKVRKVADMGGSAGHLATYLAEQFPHLQIINQDLPNVISDNLKAPSQHPRVKHQVQSYFDPQPASNSDVDAYSIRRCLHNVSDELCVKILAAAVPGLVQYKGEGKARLLIIEHLLPNWNAYSNRRKTKWVRREDILMMIIAGGKERTVAEFEVLLKRADESFEIEKVHYGRSEIGPLGDHFGVLECVLKTSSAPYPDQ